MEATTVTQVNPAELIGMFRTEMQQLMKDMPASTPADELLSTEEAMDLLKIDSKKGFAAWCKRHKVFGKRTGKGNLFLKSRILATFH